MTVRAGGNQTPQEYTLEDRKQDGEKKCSYSRDKKKVKERGEREEGVERRVEGKRRQGRR